MKKIFLVCLFVLLLSLTSPVLAKTFKLIAETQNDFSTVKPSENLMLKISGDYKLPNGEYIPDGTLLSGKIVGIVKPKRGKRDAYAFLQLTQYKLPENDEFQIIDNPNAVAKISKYEPIDLKDKGIDAGVSVAGFFVKNISYPVNFVRGAIDHTEGENPLVSGAKLTYEKSFFSYASKGKELELPAGSELTVTFTYNAD